MTTDPKAIHTAQLAAQTADTKKAHNVRIVDVSERLAIADCFVIASADNERLVNAVADGIEERLLAERIKPVRREGGKEGRWILLDYIDVVVHIQHEAERQFYGLDSLWKDCPTIAWEASQTAEEE